MTASKEQSRPTVIHVCHRSSGLNIPDTRHVDSNHMPGWSRVWISLSWSRFSLSLHSCPALHWLSYRKCCPAEVKDSGDTSSVSKSGFTPFQERLTSAGTSSLAGRVRRHRVLGKQNYLVCHPNLTPRVVILITGLKFTRPSIETLVAPLSSAQTAWRQLIQRRGKSNDRSMFVIPLWSLIKTARPINSLSCDVKEV